MHIISSSSYGSGNAVESRDVAVRAGETLNLVFLHQAGEIKPTLAAKPGGRPLARVRWSINSQAFEVAANESKTVELPFDNGPNFSSVS